MTSEEFIHLDSDKENETTELVIGKQTFQSIELSEEADADVGDNQILQSIELLSEADADDNQTLQIIESSDEADTDAGDQKVLQTMPHDNHFIHHSSVPQESIKMARRITEVETMDIVESGNKQTHCTEFSIIGDNVMEETTTIGVKRSRLTSDERPSVHVVYKSLTRASRKKLEELLHQWSQWHAKNEASSDGSQNEELEHGEETYFPALYVGLDKSAVVSFLVDKRARTEESDYVDSDSVPLYDRGYALGLTSSVLSANSEGLESLEASRCFNCGSYSHSLKECPKPRDNAAISEARKQHTSKRNSASGSRNSMRYYQSSSGKYDDLKAGVLSPELRKCLGIGELDPPPWLHRMRELGYPPGYLDVEEDEDQPSGLTIYADPETKTEYEEGELPEEGEPEPPVRKMTVEFPGINAPIPENADRRLWKSSIGFPSSSESFKSRSQHGATHSETHRSNFSNTRHSWDYRDYDQPGLDSGLPSSAISHSPGYSSYDYGSPDLRRSLSDRGRGFEYHEGSAGHVRQNYSPYSSLHSLSSSERYNWSSSMTDHRTFDNNYSSSADDTHWRDRYSHRHHQRR